MRGLRRNRQFQSEKFQHARIELCVRRVTADDELGAHLALAQYGAGVLLWRQRTPFDTDRRQRTLPLVTLRHASSPRPGRKNAEP
jgi:hypothetical protein